MYHQETVHDVDLGPYTALPERDRPAVDVLAV
jgi:hypothetical protein